MKHIIRIAVLVLLSISLAGTLSQSSRADGIGQDYIIGPDDVVDVSVANHETLNQTVTVGPDGIVSLREFGDVKASGKTLVELKRLIQIEVDKTYNNAPVHVSVKERNSQHVKIVGAVVAAGPYELKPNWRLVDLVTAAHGLSAKPKYITGYIIRGNKQIPVDFEQALADPNSAANPMLQVDDTLVFSEVEATPRKVTVEGAVLKTGTYDVDETTDPITLITLAGNVLPQSALTKVYVQRGTDRISLNLRPVIVEGKQDANLNAFRFRNNDLLFVPAVTEKYSVIGLVLRPGQYSIPEFAKPTLMEAVQAAGGFAPTAKASNAEIIRPGPDGKMTIVKVNLDAVFKKGDIVGNRQILAGDTLYIPEKGKRGIQFQDVMNPLLMLRILGLGL